MRTESVWSDRLYQVPKKGFINKQGRSKEDHQAWKDEWGLEGFLEEVKQRGEGRHCSEENRCPITTVIHLE